MIMCVWVCVSFFIQSSKFLSSMLVRKLIFLYKKHQFYSFWPVVYWLNLLFLAFSNQCLEILDVNTSKREFFTLASSPILHYSLERNYHKIEKKNSLWFYKKVTIYQKFVCTSNINEWRCIGSSSGRGGGGFICICFIFLWLLD